jgi:hypothetical protein
MRILYNVMNGRAKRGQELSAAFLIGPTIKGEGERSKGVEPCPNLFLQVGAVNNRRKVARTSIMGLGNGMNVLLLLEASAVIGSVEECRSRLAEYAQLGADFVLLECTSRFDETLLALGEMLRML